MKAIKVTKENTSRLADEFDDLSVEELETCIDYWLLANFGEEAAFEGFIFDEDFTLEWKKVKELQNDWIEVV